MEEKTFCVNCGEEHNKKDLIKVNNEYICNECLQNNYIICNNCNSYVHKQYIYHNSCYNCSSEERGFYL